MSDLGEGNLKRVIEIVGDRVCDMKLETKVAGTSFIKNSKGILEALSLIDRKQIMIDFERESSNEHDSNAVKVIVGIKGKKTTYYIGYIPKQVSETFAFVLDGDRYCIKVDEAFVLGGDRFCADNYGLKFKYHIEKT